MNNKRIQLTKVKRLMEFPPLSDGKQGRVWTKHFTNMGFILPPDAFSLLSFLVYQSKADNTLEYKESLLKTYSKTVSAGTEFYKTESHLNTTLPRLRDNFQYLIENGLLLPTATPKQFMINPCLTYSKLYVRADYYKTWVELYGEGKVGNNLKDLTSDYCAHVQRNMQRRKQ